MITERFRAAESLFSFGLKNWGRHVQVTGHPSLLCILRGIHEMLSISTSGHLHTWDLCFPSSQCVIQGWFPLENSSLSHYLTSGYHLISGPCTGSCQHYMDTLSQCWFLGPTPIVLNEKLWERSLAIQFNEQLQVIMMPTKFWDAVILAIEHNQNRCDSSPAFLASLCVLITPVTL